LLLIWHRLCKDYCYSDLKDLVSLWSSEFLSLDNPLHISCTVYSRGYCTELCILNEKVKYLLAIAYRTKMQKHHNNRHSSIWVFLNKNSLYTGTKWQLPFNFWLFCHPSFHDNKNHWGVCSHADDHGNLYFIMHITCMCKLVLCCFVVFSSLVVYVEYLETFKNLLLCGR